MGTEINTAAIRFKTTSPLAYLAARVMRSSSCALVLGKTIHLHGTDVAGLKANAAWWQHELVHVAQYQRYGLIPFLVRYTWYSLRFGYKNNPLEIEARAAEKKSL
ncbi:MAG: eCIS core domain-containing protein [Chitinophagaceae bacterium]